MGDPSERFNDLLDCGCEVAQGTVFYCEEHLPRPPAEGAGPPAPDPRLRETRDLADQDYATGHLSHFWFQRVRALCDWLEAGAAVPAPPAGLCTHPFDSMVCVAPAGHAGPHVTSNERFPHGLQLPVSPGAPSAARIAPTDAMIDAAQKEFLKAGEYEHASSTEQFRMALALKAALRAALAAAPGPPQEDP